MWKNLGKLIAEAIDMRKRLANLSWPAIKQSVQKFWDKSGFAVVLLVCAGVIGMSMYIGGRQAPQDELAVETPPMPTLRPIAAVTTPPSLQPVAAVTPEPTQPPLSLPLIGSNGMGYSPDELVYSASMGEWTVHEGIDILAPQGTRVNAAADGVVAEAFADDSWGNVVIIDHGDGLMTGYASLDSMQAAQGEAVVRGQQIGTAGISAQIECEEGAHIHFYVLLDGHLVNPMDYLR